MKWVEGVASGFTSRRGEANLIFSALQLHDTSATPVHLCVYNGARVTSRLLSTMESMITGQCRRFFTSFSRHKKEVVQLFYIPFITPLPTLQYLMTTGGSQRTSSIVRGGANSPPISSLSYKSFVLELESLASPIHQHNIPCM